MNLEDPLGLELLVKLVCLQVFMQWLIVSPEKLLDFDSVSLYNTGFELYMHIHSFFCERPNTIKTCELLNIGFSTIKAY